VSSFKREVVEVGKFSASQKSKAPWQQAHRKESHHMAKQTYPKGGSNDRQQIFSFSAPDARSVQLVGDFTQWQERPINLQKGADGVWRTTVQLAPGTHHYRFLVDGQWRDDPECILRAPNPFGSEDMMRQVA
jgi:1,4-alpha-glucan branching enzyme